MTTHTGQRAVVEAVDEIRYATEYDPATAVFTPNVDFRAPPTIQPETDMTLFEGIPRSFETRNAGVTLEVEPTVSPDGKKIALSLNAQHVRLNGFNKVTIEKPTTGGKTVVEQPEFKRMNVTTLQTLKNGQRVLLGVFRISEPEKHFEFFILKAEAKPADADAGENAGAPR